MAYKQNGYLRENVYEAGFNVVTMTDDTITLKDRENGNLELWAVADHYAGYAIDFNGHLYEFVRTLS